MATTSTSTGDTEATGTLTEDGDSETVVNLIAGTDYTLAEGDVGPEYALDSIVCDDDDVTDGSTFSVVVGEITECTITNVLQNGTLTVNKVVVNDNGGSATPDDFSFELDGGASQPFEADGSNDLTVNPGTHNATETPITGYTMTGNTCVDVLVPAGGTASCTITNNDQPGTLTVNKVVVNDNGGDADGRRLLVRARRRRLAAVRSRRLQRPHRQRRHPQRHRDPDHRLHDDRQHLRQRRRHQRRHGQLHDHQRRPAGHPDGQQGRGQRQRRRRPTPDDFSFELDGGASQPFEADGSNALTVNAGTHNATETPITGYTMTGNTCVDVLVVNGGTASCTITNDDQAATLIVKKIVINDNGGEATADDFTFQVNGGAAVTFEADGQNDLSVEAGTYSVTEPPVAGYTTTYDTCTGL